MVQMTTMQRKRKSLTTPPNIVVIGGGTGTFVVLSGLRDHNVILTALISMMDSGGSTGRLRDQLGVLPPGDLRQALVALSDSPKVWRDLFLYRFENGDLAGHNFGNIFITALEKMTGSILTGVDLAADLLKTKGVVLPITTDKTNLCAQLEDGTILERESIIDEETPGRQKITNLYLTTPAKPTQKVITAIRQADYIIFGPGDLFTSILPNLLVEGITAELKKSKSHKIYICNLVTKLGQTVGFKASTHLTELEKYLQGTKIDTIVMNNQPPSKKILTWYKKYGVELVEDDFAVVKKTQNRTDLQVVRADLITETLYKKNPADRVTRSLLRHDSAKLGGCLLTKIIKTNLV